MAAQRYLAGYMTPKRILEVKTPHDVVGKETSFKLNNPAAGYWEDNRRNIKQTNLVL